jgi:hypothetical protein
MGDARRNRERQAAILKVTEDCIYCGGKAAGTTIDHVPPRAIFDRKHRPKGLEFPCCAPCNEGGRQAEQVVAMFSRFYPDTGNLERLEEFRRLVKGVANNCPGILTELMPTARQRRKVGAVAAALPGVGGALNAKGPLTNRALQLFAGKMAFALHFAITGRVVPIGGGASVWWVTNFQAYNGEVPASLTDQLGPIQTLRQGRWNVADQFTYASAATAEGDMSVHLATFRVSFAICAGVSSEVGRIQPPAEIEHVKVHEPGFLLTG